MQLSAAVMILSTPSWRVRVTIILIYIRMTYQVPTLFCSTNSSLGSGLVSDFSVFLFPSFPVLLINLWDFEFGLETRDRAKQGLNLNSQSKMKKFVFGFYFYANFQFKSVIGNCSTVVGRSSSLLRNKNGGS